jgi:hypothetical protein
LKTLDFITELFASKKWEEKVPTLKENFPGETFGGWRSGVDFLRIDGSVNACERGEMVQDFSKDSAIKVFLISSLAGGVGINLVSASRVVVFDSHFNPSVDLQAIYRCYRYGQVSWSDGNLIPNDSSRN